MSIKYKILLPIALGSLLAAGCNKTASNTQQSSAQNNQSQMAATTVSGSMSQKFTDQPYYKMSYLISGDTLSTDAKMALSGFKMSKQTLANGDTEITLTAQKTSYHDQQYELKPGDQLYFIEKNLKDDDGTADTDEFMGDDEAVLVDSQGNVVGQPQGWTNGSGSGSMAPMSSSSMPGMMMPMSSSTMPNSQSGQPTNQ